MGRKSLDESVVVEEGSTDPTSKDIYAQQCAMVNPIAAPMASRKLAKKIYKLVGKSSGTNDRLRKGLAEVQKALRKNEKGIVVLAGNVSPIDIYSHIPGICESRDITYVYTPSRESLGVATGIKRPIITLLIKPSDEYQALYDEVEEGAKAIAADF